MTHLQNFLDDAVNETITLLIMARNADEGFFKEMRLQNRHFTEYNLLPVHTMPGCDKYDT